MASALLVLFLQTSLVLLIALVECRFARRAPALRQLICRVALLAVIGVFAGRLWLTPRPKPIVPIQVPVSWSTTGVIAPDFAGRLVAPAIQPGSSSSKVAAGKTQPVSPVSNPAPTLINFETSLLLLWAIGSGFLSLQFLVGFATLARLRRRGQEVKDPDLLARLGASAKALGIRTPTLVEGEDFAGLFVAGVLRPAIYLPTHMRDELLTDELDALLRHEAAHVAGGDLMWGLARRVLGILLWWNPLLWLLRGPMESAAEEVCDRYVLSSGFDVARYADCLLGLQAARSRVRYPALAIGAVSGRSKLTARIEAILDTKRPKATRLPRVAVAGVILGGFAVALGASSVFARPTFRAQSEELSGWVMKPYSAKVRVVDSEGRLITGPASAWLVVSGKTFPVVVKAGIANVHAEGAQELTRGSLVVYQPGRALGFVMMWPATKRAEQVTLGTPHTISGRVVSDDGKPIAGVEFRPTSVVRFGHGLFEDAPLRFIPHFDLAAKTDATGHFKLPDMPAECQVNVDHGDPRFASVAGMLSFNTPKTGDNEETTIYLRPAASVSGTVTLNGAPISGIRVESQGCNGSPGDAEARTDAVGHFVLSRLPAGRINVAVEIPDRLEDRYTCAAVEGLRLEPGQNKTIQLQLIPGVEITGTLLDEKGDRVAHKHVGIYGPAHPQTSAWVQAVLTDAHGDFRARVPAGKQYIYAEDMPTSGGINVTVTEGSHPHINVHGSSQSASQDEAIGVGEPENQPGVYNGTAKPPAPIRTPAVMSFGPGAPFYGPQTLPNGATVRLAFVQDDFRGPHTPWSPDGSEAKHADASLSLDMDGFRKKDPDDPRAVFLYVDIQGATRGDYYCIVKVPHPSDWTVWQSYGDQHGGTLDMASFRAPKTLQQTDMKFGIAAGPYTTAIRCGLGEAPLNAVASSGDPGPPATLVGQANAGITIEFPAKYEGQDVRLDAYDQNGKKLELASWQNDTQIKDGHRTRRYGFITTGATRISRVELVARDYQWVTFKGIHLYPSGHSGKP